MKASDAGFCTSSWRPAFGEVEDGAITYERCEAARNGRDRMTLVVTASGGFAIVVRLF